MRQYRLEPRADRRLDEIAGFTREQWGDEQARTYLVGLFRQFDLIANGLVPSRPISSSFGLGGFQRRWRSHIIYWRFASEGEIAIVSVLHMKMDQRARLKDDVS